MLIKKTIFKIGLQTIYTGTFSEKKYDMPNKLLYSNVNEVSLSEDNR